MKRTVAAKKKTDAGGEAGEVLALTGGTVCRLDPPDLRQLTVVVENGQISGLTASPPAGATVIDCQGLYLMPGFVNAHTQLWTGAERGMAPPREKPINHVQRFERRWAPLGRALDAERLTATVEAAALTALAAGTTTVFDLFGGFDGGIADGSLDLIAEALERVGLRGVLAFGTTDGAAGEPRRGIAESDRFLSSLAAKPRARIRGLVGAGGSNLLSDQTAEALTDLALRHRAAVHLPIAEDSVDAQRDSFFSAAAWLTTRGLVRAGSVFAHGTYLSDDDAARLRDAGVYLAHAPHAAMTDGADYARPGRFGTQSVLGSGHAGVDVLAEASLSQLLASAHHHTFDVVGAIERGRALATWHYGVPFELAPGAAADLIAVAYAAPTPIDNSSLVAHLLSGSWKVRHVLIDGELVLQNGRSPRVDEEAVFARAREAAAVAQKLART